MLAQLQLSQVPYSNGPVNLGKASVLNPEMDFSAVNFSDCVHGYYPAAG
jgi:hypothetical protein